jgi:hypothetical protein
MSEDLQTHVEHHRRFRSSLERIMMDAARRAHVEIDPKSIIHLNAAGARIINATIKDLNKKTLAELNTDSTIGLIYLWRKAASKAAVANGFYTVRLAPGNHAHLVDLSGKRIATVAVTTELHIQSPARPSSRPLGSFSYNTGTGCGSADWHFHLFGWVIVFTYAWCD